MIYFISCLYIGELIQLDRFPEGVPWVRYHGTYKDLHINIIWPGKDLTLGMHLVLVICFVLLKMFL